MNCPGCGQDFEPKSAEQKRCSTCIVQIVGALGKIPTASIVALLGKHQDDPDIEAITLEDVIRILNEILREDPRAITTLVEQRVPINLDLLNHPSISAYPGESGGDWYLGVLGIISGLFGVKEKGAVLAKWGNSTRSGHIQEFVRAADHLDEVETEDANPGEGETEAGPIPAG